MQFTTTFSTLALFVSAVFAAPTLAPRALKKFNGETTGRLIVTLKDSAKKADVLGAAGIFTTSDYDDWEILNAFVGM